MKSANMNRQSLVSIFRLMFLVFGVLGILLTSLFLVSCGGDEEEEPPEAPVSPPLNDLGACAAGMTLKLGESCSYVAGKANVVFLSFRMVLHVEKEARSLKRFLVSKSRLTPKFVELTT